MAFDFPSSPASGDVYAPSGGPSWQYDGEKWKGGQPSGPQTEQFIDYSGKSSVNVPVPTWAKSCRVTMSITPTAAGSMSFRISTDGTTFIAGASDYTYTTPYHVAAPSPGAWSSGAMANASQAALSAGTDVLTVAHTIVAEISLVRPVASDAITYKSRGTSYHSTSQLMSAWFHGYVATGVMGGVLTVKALQFFGLTGKAGSHIHVQWIGDAASVPISNAIADCPSDGGEYMRVNGVWRLSKQTFVAPFAGNVVIFTPPAGARTALVKAALWAPSANQTAMQWSADGTTWAAGASDYSYAGWIHYAGSATPGFAVQPSTNATFFPLSGISDNASIPTLIELMQPVYHPQGVYTAKWSSSFYNSAAAQTMVQYNLTGWSNNAPIAAAASLKFRLQPSAVAWSAGSWMTVEWLY